MIEKQNTTHQNLCGTDKEELRRKSMAVNTYIKKKKDLKPKI